MTTPKYPRGSSEYQRYYRLRRTAKAQAYDDWQIELERRLYLYRDLARAGRLAERELGAIEALGLMCRAVGDEERAKLFLSLLPDV